MEKSGKPFLSNNHQKSPTKRKRFKDSHVRLVQINDEIEGYQLKFLIGIGGYGEVYKVIQKKTQRAYAMKVERRNKAKSSLQHEISILKEIENYNFFPKVLCSGTSDVYDSNFFVMNIFGLSLSALTQKYGNKLPCAESLILSQRMLSIIERLHDLSYLHCDIKPSNFLLQKPQELKEPLILIDFGLARKFDKPENDSNNNNNINYINNIDISPNENLEQQKERARRYTGTRKYSSSHVQSGGNYSRRDDLISWFYSTVEIFKGRLPWTNCENGNEMAEIKSNTDVNLLCFGMPWRFVSIYQKLMELNTVDRPNYDAISKLIDESMEEISFDPKKFDWNEFYLDNSSISDLRRYLNNPYRGREANQKNKANMENDKKSGNYCQKKRGKNTEENNCSEEEHDEEEEQNCCIIQ